MFKIYMPKTDGDPREPIRQFGLDWVETHSNVDAQTLVEAIQSNSDENLLYLDEEKKIFQMLTPGPTGPVN